MTANDFTYILSPLINCGYCHTCQSRLTLARLSDRQPDEHGEEYCQKCDSFPDYASHSKPVRGGSCPDYRMKALQTRLRLIASPEVVRMLRRQAHHRA
jgi:hypothetical protein